MPSLHVSIAWLLFLACRSYAPSRILGLLAGIYALVILVTSVNLGWHYASDGVVGIIVISLIWWGTGRFVDWLEEREQRTAAPQSSGFPLPASA